MEKDDFLEVILHDLKEVETLVQSFKGKPGPSKAFFKLTRNKVNSILEEMEMLEEMTEQADKDLKDKDQHPISSNITAVKEENKNILPLSANISETKELKELSKQEIATPSPKEPEKQDKKEPEKEQTIIPEPDREENTKETTTSDHTATENEPTEPSQSSPETQQEADKNVLSTDTRKTSRVLGEKLIREKASFNEEIQRKTTTGAAKRSLTAPPISDLRKALGINDRFFFQRELFGSNADLMNQTLDQLNQMKEIEEARQFLLANFNWDVEDEAVASFMELLERRFF
jgi:hypothetical protein